MKETQRHPYVLGRRPRVTCLTRGNALVIALTALALTGGCQGSRSTQGPLLIFPAPPDKPRIQFLTWASGAEQVETPKSTLAKLALGDEPTAGLMIEKPYGVAARDGVVYVCDTKMPGLYRLDFKNRTLSGIGIQGPGRLRKPINIIIDPAGYKFVADADRRQIVIFGPDEQYVTAFDVPNPSHPVDVALWENELYVLDNDDTCQIVVMDRQTGDVLRTFGAPGEEPGQFRIPNSLCFGPDGYLYVSDTLNWRIQKFTREGKVVWAQGTWGRRLGQFVRNRGLRVAPNGIIFVADAGTEIVQMFDDNGQILMHFGGPGSVPGALVLPATVAIDSTSIPYFKQYIHKDFNAEYLVFVTSQFGEHLLSIYAFGSFPNGYKLSQSQIGSLPPVSTNEFGKPAKPPEPPVQEPPEAGTESGRPAQEPPEKGGG